MRALAHTEWWGIPIDAPKLSTLRQPSFAPVRHGLHGDLPRQKPPTRGLNPRSHTSAWMRSRRAWRGEADLRHPSLDRDSQERCGLRPTHGLGETGQEEHLNLEEHEFACSISVVDIEPPAAMLHGYGGPLRGTLA